VAAAEVPPGARTGALVAAETMPGPAAVTGQTPSKGSLHNNLQIQTNTN
jgi:hypothetical protein